MKNKANQPIVKVNVGSSYKQEEGELISILNQNYAMVKASNGELVIGKLLTKVPELTFDFE
jgi:hypothetical protein